MPMTVIVPRWCIYVTAVSLLLMSIGQMLGLLVPRHHITYQSMHFDLPDWQPTHNREI